MQFDTGQAGAADGGGCPSMKAKETIATRDEAWPALPLSEWQETCATVHMWTQIVGKVRLALSPHFNHWWEVPLYLSARGLTTSPIPYESEVFEVQFDFISHTLDIVTEKPRPCPACASSFFAAA